MRPKTKPGVSGLLPRLPFLRRRRVEQLGLEGKRRTMHITDDALVFELEGQRRCLVLSRKEDSAGGARATIRTRKEAGATPASPGYINSVAVDAIFGIYDLMCGPHVAVVTRSKQRFADVAAGVEFRQASKMYLIPLLRRPLPLDEDGQREEARLVELLRRSFAGHQLYFSTAFDVTQTLQRHAAARAAATAATAASGATSGSALNGTFGGVSLGAGCRSRQRTQCMAGRNAPANGTAVADLLKSSGAAAGTTLTAETVATVAAEAEAAAAPPVMATKRRPWLTADPHFFWNYGVLGPIIESCEMAPTEADARAAAAWVTPFVSAFVQVERDCEVADDVGSDTGSDDEKFAKITCGGGSCGRLAPRFTLLFVSRRSRFRQGTRFTRRGIDSAGNVANFVETEQAVLFEDGQRMAHVQVRGSIPLFWSSPVNLKYHPPVRIGDDAARTAAALRLHALALLGRYGGGYNDFGGHSDGRGGVVLVNLVDKKSDQGRLGEALDSALTALREDAAADARAAEAAVAAAAAASRVAARTAVAPGKGGSAASGGKGLPRGADGVAVTAAGAEEAAAAAKAAAARRWERQAASLRHVWFDFHEECRGGRVENLGKLLAAVNGDLASHGFLHIAANGTVLQTQSGVVRTNCMDCLDRTNVVQSLFARRTLLQQLAAAGCLVASPMPAAELLTDSVGEEAAAAGAPAADGAGRVAMGAAAGAASAAAAATAAAAAAVGSRSIRSKSASGPGGARAAFAGASRAGAPHAAKRRARITARGSALHSSGASELADQNTEAFMAGLPLLALPGQRLEMRFREMWGNNADEISLLYTGTPALKRDFTRTGRRTKMGLMEDGTNSVLRYLINNFIDHRRQEAVDLLLGTYRPMDDVARPSLTPAAAGSLGSGIGYRDGGTAPVAVGEAADVVPLAACGAGALGRKGSALSAVSGGGSGDGAGGDGGNGGRGLRGGAEIARPARRGRRKEGNDSVGRTGRRSKRAASPSAAAATKSKAAALLSAPASPAAVGESGAAPAARDWQRGRAAAVAGRRRLSAAMVALALSRTLRTKRLSVANVGALIVAALCLLMSGRQGR